MLFVGIFLLESCCFQVSFNFSKWSCSPVSPFLHFPVSFFFSPCPFFFFLTQILHGLSASALLTFGAESFVEAGCPEPWRVSGSLPGLCPPDASSIPPPTVVTIRKCLQILPNVPWVGAGGQSIARNCCCSRERRRTGDAWCPQEPTVFTGYQYRFPSLRPSGVS